MEKTNPRKKPCTQADVNKALVQGRAEGFHLLLTLVVWILADKHDASDEDIRQLSKEIQYLLENICDRNVKFPEIRKALKEEHDWEVALYMNEKFARGVHGNR